MNNDYKKLEQYEMAGVFSTEFNEVLKDIEKDIITKFKKSPELAVEAFYEQQAIDRIRSKLQSVKVLGTVELHNSEDKTA